jgi:hypothetical protein
MLAIRAAPFFRKDSAIGSSRGNVMQLVSALDAENQVICFMGYSLYKFLFKCILTECFPIFTYIHGPLYCFQLLNL